ncbi:retrovirus-related pol polyprotein from transposon TNT 1-94 [Tanacetum coccineum]
MKQAYLGLHNRTALSKDGTELLWKLLVTDCSSLRKLTFHYGAKAVANACYTLNRSLVHTLHGKTYYELLKGKKPNLQYFRVFGSLCYPTNDYDDVGKLKAKADIGIFVGYAPTKKAYRIYNKRTRKIQETVHVAFDELTEGLTSVQTSSGLAPQQNEFCANQYSTRTYAFCQEAAVLLYGTKDLQQALEHSCWIEAMQEEIHEFERLDDLSILKGIINMGLVVSEGSGFELKAFSDGLTMQDVLTHGEGTSGSAQFLGYLGLLAGLSIKSRKVKGVCADYIAERLTGSNPLQGQDRLPYSFLSGILKVAAALGVLGFRIFRVSLPCFDLIFSIGRSNKASLNNDGNLGSLLSELAKKVKNIDRKILGRDGKPMIPYRCVKDKVTFADDVAIVMENKNDDGEVGSFKSASINTENNHGAADVIGEDCTLADVIIPNAWGKYGFKNVMVHHGFFMFQFSTKEGMENILDQEGPVWVKLFNVPVVAYSKVGLNLITAKLGRLIKLDAHTSNMCLNSWGMNSYARVLVEISAKKELVESLVVAVPIDKNKGLRLVSVEIEFEYRPPRCSVCKVFDHIDKECHKNEKEEMQNTNKEDGLGYDKRKSKGINQASKANNNSRFSFSKGKTKLIYRPVVKPTNTMLSPSKPKDSSSHNSKEDVNVACDKPTEPSNVTNKRMEEDKVIDLNTDVVVSTNNSYAPEKDNGSKKVSFLEQFLKTREASKNKHNSLLDSNESEVEEVCMPEHISGGGSLDRLEDDLDGYDGYEAQFCDLNEQGQDFCD